MATGSQSLEQIRAAGETTEGTPVTPTRYLYAPQGAVTPLYRKEGILVELAWNKQDSVNDVLSGIETAGFDVKGVPGSYEDFSYWLMPFDAAHGETPATVDTTAYSRTGAPSQTDNTMSATGVRSISVQFGASDFIGTWGMSIPGLIGEELTVNFNKRASGNDTGVTFDAKYMTASTMTAITAFTGSLSDRTQTWATGNALKSYIDTSTMGSTADANVTHASFNLKKQNVYHDGMDASGLHTTMHRPKGWQSTLSFTRKFSDLTELNAYLGVAGVKTLRKVRIEAVGAQVGAVSAKNTIRLDFVGKALETDESTRQYIDGLWYQNFTLRGMYDSTNTASWKFFTQNSIATAFKTA